MSDYPRGPFEPEDWFAKYMEAQAELSAARGALAFVRGVLGTTKRFDREITPGMVNAILHEIGRVLDKEDEK